MAAMGGTEPYILYTMFVPIHAYIWLHLTYTLGTLRHYYSKSILNMRFLFLEFPFNIFRLQLIKGN